jgi:hypothetical protein
MSFPNRRLFIPGPVGYGIRRIKLLVCSVSQSFPCAIFYAL